MPAGAAGSRSLLVRSVGRHPAAKLEAGARPAGTAAGLWLWPRRRITGGPGRDARTFLNDSAFFTLDMAAVGGCNP